MEGPPRESPKFPQPTFAPPPLVDDPIANHLAWARAEKAKAEASWFTVSYAEDDGGVMDALQVWTHIVCTLEALQSAAKLSRRLHGDCVQLPSRDPKHLRDPVVLHSLLMQQLDSLTTRLGDGYNARGSVPLAIRPVAPVPTLAWVDHPRGIRSAHRQEEGLEEEDVGEEEDQGSSCTIT